MMGIASVLNRAAESKCRLVSLAENDLRDIKNSNAVHDMVTNRKN